MQAFSKRIYFYSHLTDFSGYDGAFTLGHLWFILFLFIPIWFMYYVGNFGGYSIGKYFALYLIGYYVLRSDLILKKIEQNIKWLAVLCAAGTIVSGVLYYKFSYYGDLWVNFIGWSCVLVLLALGKRFFDRQTKFTEYFNRASYPIYMLHQTILVILAYYIVALTDILYIQVFCICIGSFLLTVFAYHLIGAIPFVRKTIGVWR